MEKEEAGGAKSQEYYWEQEKQLFAIRRYFYEQNLLPKDDSYFPDDVINVAATLQAENKRLKILLIAAEPKWAVSDWLQRELKKPQKDFDKTWQALQEKP